MEPRISFVTLGVSDLKRATRFYEEVLRLPRLACMLTVEPEERAGTYGSGAEGNGMIVKAGQDPLVRGRDFWDSTAGNR